jgi:hypothetical protein
MQISTLLENIKPEWRRQFVQFIDSGEADSTFLAYVDSDADAQRAVEAAFNVQAAALEELSQSLQAATAANTASAPASFRIPIMTPARAHG